MFLLHMIPIKSLNKYNHNIKPCLWIKILPPQSNGCFSIPAPHYKDGETVKGQTYLVSHRFEDKYVLSTSDSSFANCTFMPCNREKKGFILFCDLHTFFARLKYILLKSLYVWLLSHMSSTMWSRLHHYVGKLST